MNELFRTPSAQELTRRRRRRWNVFWSVVLAAAAFFVIVQCGGCLLHNAYSEGYRDGHVFKFSRKGTLFKTWEGEMATVGVPGANVWEFSVTDDEVARQVGELTDSDHVRLHYEEVRLHFAWQGETTYRVVRVEYLDKRKE